MSGPAAPSSPGVVILTNPSDFHSFAVAEALRRKGLTATLWQTTDFPSRQEASAWVDGASFSCEISGPGLGLGNHSPTTVWARRPVSPVVPPDLDAADHPFALRECKHFFASLVRAVGASSFWVNPVGSFSRASLKLEQLKAAALSGLKLPRTLLSNDPFKIREFVRSHEAIYKAFYPVSWRKEDGLIALFSAPLTEQDLPEDGVLRAIPGIFQERVPKAFELRITAIGRHLFAAALDSQAIPAARVDWRAAATSVPVSTFDLPEAVAKSCRQIMADLGLVFGCFDLIVTPSGDFVFLEVNEMGAFLWIEEQNPELRLLDAFCELLIQRTPDFALSRPAASIRLEEVYSAALKMKEEAGDAHVGAPMESLLDEAQV